MLTNKRLFLAPCFDMDCCKLEIGQIMKMFNDKNKCLMHIFFKKNLLQTNQIYGNRFLITKYNLLTMFLLTVHNAETQTETRWIQLKRSQILESNFSPIRARSLSLKQPESRWNIIFSFMKDCTFLVNLVFYLRLIFISGFYGYICTHMLNRLYCWSSKMHFFNIG